MKKLWLNRDRKSPSNGRGRKGLVATSIGATMALTSILYPAAASANPALTHLVKTRCLDGRGVIDITLMNGTNEPVDVNYDVTELQSFPSRTMTADPLAAATASVTGRHDATYTVTMSYAGLERTERVDVNCVPRGLSASQDFSWEVTPTCESSGGMLNLVFSNGTDDPVDYSWDITELRAFAPRSATAQPDSSNTHRVTGRHDDVYTLTVEYNGLERTEQVEVDCVPEGLSASQDFSWEITPVCAPSGGVIELVFSNGTDEPVSYSWDITELYAFAPRTATVGVDRTKTHNVYGRHDRRYTVTIEYNGLERTEQVDVDCQP